MKLFFLILLSAVSFGTATFSVQPSVSFDHGGSLKDLKPVSSRGLGLDVGHIDKKPKRQQKSVVVFACERMCIAIWLLLLPLFALEDKYFLSWTLIGASTGIVWGYIAPKREATRSQKPSQHNNSVATRGGAEIQRKNRGWGYILVKFLCIGQAAALVFALQGTNKTDLRLWACLLLLFVLERALDRSGPFGLQ